MSAATGFGVGLMLVGLVGFAAVSGEPQATGAVATTDEKEICAVLTVETPSSIVHISYARRYRKLLLEEEKRADFVRAGVPWPQDRPQPKNWRLDHIVPLAIGGADVPDNRRPEEIAESKSKDKVEEALWEALCHQHSISARNAQAIFLPGGNWRNELWRVK